LGCAPLLSEYDVLIAVSLAILIVTQVISSFEIARAKTHIFCNRHTSESHAAAAPTLSCDSCLSPAGPLLFTAPSLQSSR